jgi:hypothetical protein
VKRYAPNAAPDDPDVWRDMSGLWPTRLGTYKTSHSLEARTKTATGETAVRYAYCAKTLTGTRMYVVGAVGIWEASNASANSSTLTDRTGGVTIGTNPIMTEYGNATIAAMGTSAATVVSTGGNFAALGGTPPNAEIVVTCRNAVLLFNYNDGVNTYNDGWWASDIGDHTAWTPATSNQAANGRLLDTNGPVVAAVVLDDVVYALKTDAIYRGMYVGRPLIWQWDCVVRGVGAVSGAKSAIVAAGNEMVFAASSANGVTQTNIMRYDGVSPPRWIDHEINLPVIASGSNGADFLYDDSTQTLFVSYRLGRRIYAYNTGTGAWGRTGNVVSNGLGAVACAVNGEMTAIIAHFNSSSSASPHVFYRSAADTLTLQYPTGAGVPNGTLTTTITSHRYGRTDRKTSFSRVTPWLRSRTTAAGGGGAPAASLSMKTFNERHASSSSGAVSTLSISEATNRNRFDTLQAGSTECFAEFTVTYTDLVVEIDDLLVESKDSGAN